MLSGLFRRAMPLIKRELAVFGKQALRTRLQVANDVADGGKVEDSLRMHPLTGIK